MKKSRLMVISIPLLIVISLLLLYQRYTLVQKDLAESREDQALKVRVLKKSMALIAEKPYLEKKAATLRELRKASDSRLTDGQTISIVSAGLQDTVRSVIAGRGGSILSERSGKAEAFESFKVITVTVDSVMPDVRSLSDALYAIETRTPYLIVKELDVRVRNVRAPMDLSVRFDVSGLTGTNQ